ncbi:MAG: DUF1684 domain-containing protein [Anaerolineales bacterium]
MNPLDEFHKEKDEYFAKDSHSPLTDEQKRNFEGLKYFPENPGLRLELPIEEFSTKEKITMQTTTGDVQTYRRFGKIRFTVEEREAELTVYQQPDGGYFLPFVDSLRGVETYPAGRYLEPRRTKAGTFEIDFNYSYNPYCAYNEHWSCPITPAENRIPVPIRAGEKIFHSEET